MRELKVKIPHQTKDIESIWDIFQDAVNGVALKDTSFHEESEIDHLLAKVRIHKEDLYEIVLESVKQELSSHNIRFDIID